MSARWRLASLSALLAGFVELGQAQVPPSATDAANYIGLHAAAHTGDIAALRKAIDTGADLEARDAHGRTALHVATFARRFEVIRALSAAGANLGALEDERYDAVSIAAVAGDDESLRVLLSLGASARLVTSPYQGTALIAAAHLGHVGVVRRLIAAGAPLDHVNNLHWTALIEAVVLGDGGARHQAIVQALLAAGADRTLTDSAGHTALDLAQSRGYGAMVALFQRQKIE